VEGAPGAEEAGALDAWKAAADIQDDLDQSSGILAAYRHGPYKEVWIHPGITRRRVVAGANNNETGWKTWTYTVPASMMREIRRGNEDPWRLLHSYFEPWLFSGTDVGSGGAVRWIDEGVDEFFGVIIRLAKTYTQYPYRGQVYAGFPHEIYQRILWNGKKGDDAIIPFYSSEILEDTYAAAEDGFTFEIASGMCDSIKRLAQNKALVIGTETAEWYLPPETSAVNIQAILNSRHGGARLRGTAIGDAAVFVQSGKKALIEYYIPQQDTSFRANNLALLAEGMLRESPARDIDFVSAPFTRIFAVREDGCLASLLYERSTGTSAWGRVTTRGKIKSAASVPGGDGYGQVYLVTEREGGYFLELLSESSEAYLDSYREWDGNEAGYGEAVVTGEDGRRWIGFSYTSVMRTMPVLANNRMEKQRVTGPAFRFLRSFLPKVSAYAGGRRIKTDTITNLKEPFSGVWKIPFPGSWDEDAQAELTHDEPSPVRVLAITAEVQ
jgi:hypothetical protein